ncbi:hypothetical protein QYF61_003886 [Mycteria americana]|uniref:Uncharacterized protein n=1 Tax=Mycteria americana TaxID=33587 RepID=A0AAN7PER4_MYCAM|nr:hypothetical protein QYF61_003886 [Mycteria americana]
MNKPAIRLMLQVTLSSTKLPLSLPPLCNTLALELQHINLEIDDSTIRYVMSPLHQGHSIPQRYSCVKGAFSLRFPVAGDKDIQILKAKEGIRKAKAQLVLQQQGMRRATKRALVSILATKRQPMENVDQVLYVARGPTDKRHGKR